MTEAGWLSDPSGRHQMRYWDGETWTEHVSDDGAQGVDPPTIESPGTGLAVVGPTDLATVEGAVTQQQDPNLLWEGSSRSLKGAATGGIAGAATYRLSRAGIAWDRGKLTNKSQQVHIAHILDVDVTQSITQKSRGVGNVTVRFTTGGSLVMADIPEPLAARDAINGAVTDYRNHAWERDRLMNAATASNINISQSVPVAGPAPSAELTVVQQLRELAELRDAGILTDEEFAAQKAKLLL